MEKEKIECCSENQVHPDLLKIVNDTMPEETELYDLAELFKVFGDSTRIRILISLCNGINDVHSLYNVGGDGVGGFDLLLRIVSSRFFTAGFVAVIPGRPARSAEQAQDEHDDRNKVMGFHQNTPGAEVGMPGLSGPTPSLSLSGFCCHSQTARSISRRVIRPFHC